MTAHEEAVQRHARVLKAMLWGMGLLMAAAAVVVVAMVVKAVNRPALSEIAAELPLPAGCAVAEMTASGDRLILMLSGPAPICSGILIADITTGKIIGRFQITGQ